MTQTPSKSATECSLHSTLGSSSIGAAVSEPATDLSLATRLNASSNGAGLEASLTSTASSALETVAAMRRGRPESPHLSSAASGPIVVKGGGSGTNSRSASQSGATRAMAAAGSGTNKLVQDSAVLTAVRRQMEALEDKLSGQIGRVQQQSDRLRDAALSRVDSKMVTMEALQPKLDRRLAELSGNYKGLSDEMQAQIRRLDQMDSRLWEWRHQLEEEVRNKFVDIEQNIQRVSSSMRVMSTTSEDSLKRHGHRVQRVEEALHDRVASSEDTQSGLMNLHERLEQLEQGRLQEIALVPADKTSSSRDASQPYEFSIDSASLMNVETRLSDACSKIDGLLEESRDAHTRLEAQEERLKSLHTRVESREEHYRWLNDRVERTDWEGRFKEIQNHMQGIDQGRAKQSEDIELVSKRLEDTQQATEECIDQIRRLYAERQILGGGSEAMPEKMQSDREALSLDMKDFSGKMEKLEARSEFLVAEIESMRAEVTTTPVAALVESLKDLAPKVIEQEACVRELLEKVGRLEVEEKMKTTQEQGRSESTAARMQRVEADVERLIVTVDALVKH